MLRVPAEITACQVSIAGMEMVSFIPGDRQPSDAGPQLCEQHKAERSQYEPLPGSTRAGGRRNQGSGGRYGVHSNAARGRGLCLDGRFSSQSCAFPGTSAARNRRKGTRRGRRSCDWSGSYRHTVTATIVGSGRNQRMHKPGQCPALAVLERGCRLRLTSLQTCALRRRSEAAPKLDERSCAPVRCARSGRG